MAPLVHVDKIDNDNASDIPQAYLPGDLAGRLDVCLKNRLFGVALLLLLRSLLGNLRTKEPELLEDGTPRPALPEMEFESELPPPELQQKAQIHQRILHLAGERPAEVTRLFKVWLMEEI